MVVSQHSPTSAPPASLTRWTDDVERKLRRLALADDTLLAHMTAYHMGWVDVQGQPSSGGGKHVRSNLCCWASEACGGSARDALQAACALELVHNFTLVHDDIQDHDRTRRGRSTVWSVWGEAQAINAGDGLFALACRALLGARGDASAIERERRLLAAEVLLDAVVEVIDGQCRDLEYERAPDTRLEAYLGMIDAKTSALLGASLEIGAIMAGADAEVRARLRRAGRLIGTSFQLRDDWLGVWGETARTGKSGHGDLARRKLTYPLAAAYAAADQHERQELASLYWSRGVEEEPRIRTLLERLRADDMTQAAADAAASEAVGEVRQCQFTPAREQEFAAIARYLADRTS